MPNRITKGEGYFGAAYAGTFSAASVALTYAAVTSGVLTKATITTAVVTSGTLTKGILTTAVVTSGTTTRGILTTANITSGTLTRAIIPTATVTSGTHTRAIITTATVTSGTTTSAVISSGLKVGSAGTVLQKLYFLSATIKPSGSIAASGAQEASYTTGLTSVHNSDIIIGFEPVTGPLTTGLGIGGVRVSASGTITIQWVNATGGAISTFPQKWRIIGARFKGA